MDQISVFLPLNGFGLVSFVVGNQFDPLVEVSFVFFDHLIGSPLKVRNNLDGYVWSGFLVDFDRDLSVVDTGPSYPGTSP